MTYNWPGQASFSLPSRRTSASSLGSRCLAALRYHGYRSSNRRSVRPSRRLRRSLRLLARFRGHIPDGPCSALQRAYPSSGRRGVKESSLLPIWLGHIEETGVGSCLR